MATTRRSTTRPISTASPMASLSPPPPPPPELDLDSFLPSSPSSSSSSDADADHRRAVDDLLLLVSSSDSESDDPNPTPRTPTQLRRLKLSPNPKPPPPLEPSPRRSTSASATLSSLVSRTFSNAAASSSSASPSKPLPSLFRSVRPSPKPGAALAAAAAASRAVPAPYAAAIKSRRSASGSFQKFLDEGASSDVSEETTLSGNLEAEVGTEAEVVEESRPPIEVAVQESSEAALVEEVVDRESEELEDKKPSEVGIEDNAEATESVETNLAVADSVVAEMIDEDEHAGDDNAAQSDQIANLAEESVQDEVSAEVELEAPEVESFDLDEDGSFMEEQMQSESMIDKMIEDRVEQLEISRKAEKKAEKKLKASMKPLEWAEELEKRQASFGQHWEEGAAAQPMRLEGIRRGPPAIGYLQIDLDNSITRAISSQTFRRDHGSPQVLAVHRSHIALGMSKGAVIVVPSKYSIHHADDTDAKMLFFWNQGEKAQSPVTAMCFNQQGDLLLVGYGDGHLNIWDVQKAAAAKVIYGEHTAAVVHACFLRQSKFITGDSKGLVLLHTFSILPLVNRLTIKSTQRLFDGHSGIVLSACPLLVDDSFGFSNSSGQGNSATSSGGGLGSMVGGVVGGVVGGESGWKLFNEGSSLVEDGVVIFVMHQNALVVRLGSTVEHIEIFSRPDGAREGSIAYAAWKCTITSNDSSLDELERTSWLAIAWDRQVQVAKLVKSKMKKYKEWKLDSAAIGVAWLDDQMLVVLTLRGQLCLFSKDGCELHRTSFILDGFGIDEIILYHTHFSNIFGNPERHFNNSVAVRGATIYILGPTHLIVSRLLPWKERIEALKKAGDWMGALDMAMRLYDGQTQGVIDLPRTVDSIREAIMPYLVELLLSYVGYVFEYISVALSNQNGKGGIPEGPVHSDSSLQTEREEQYARVGGVAVEYCVHIRRNDLLFDTVFSKFVAVQNGGTFLEVLEPYILKDMLGSLPPEIMQALVEHYSGKGWLQRVEQCILHMDISSLDFNQVVKLCREHRLYGALIYLFNQGLNDFRTPLEELLAIVQNSTRKDSSATCYRMLVYLKYCFQGLAFPPGHGTLPQSQLPSVQGELLQFLLEESKSLTSEVYRGFKTSCGKCPNLCYLLWVDTDATLEVLKCAFAQEWFKPIDYPTNSSTSTMESDDEVNLRSLASQNDLVQSIVDAIIDVLGLEREMIQSIVLPIESEFWPSDKDLSCIFEFISFVVSHKRATTSPRVVRHILDHLTSSNLSSHDGRNNSIQKERQVLQLFDVVPQTNWNSDDVLHLCLKANFHQASGLIYATRGENIPALDSYIKDTEEPFHAFIFINKILLKLAKTEALSFRSAVVSRFPTLVKLSRECTFFLTVDHFRGEIQQILSELHSDSQSLFLFLKTAIEVHLSGKIDLSRLNVTYFQVGKLQDLPNELQEYLDRLSNFPKLADQNLINITDELVELYLELLCQYERNSVRKFLETFDSYRLERCLRLCLDYGVTDAAAFLLERVGDVGTALALVTTGLGEKITLFISALENTSSRIASRSISDVEQPDVILKTSEALPVLDVLHASIGLCQRNSLRLDQEESQSLWFHLLDSFSEPLKRLYGGKDVSDKGAIPNETGSSRRQLEENEPLHKVKISDNQRCSNALRRVFSQIVGEIIEAMAGYIPLPAIMAKLLSDNGNQEFGDFKLVILRMLSTYGYEKRILDTAKSVIEDDTFYTLSLLKKGVCHAYAPQDFLCCICNCSLSKEGAASAVRVFSCGHATHLQCESEQSKPSNRESVAGCPICLSKRNTPARDKSAISENGLVKYSSTDNEQSHVIQYLHEPDNIERSRGLQQMSRFEILNNLQKAQKYFHVDTLPQLRLSPPAIYHEKIQKRKSLMGESSKSSVRSQKPHKIWQMKEPKSKKISKPIPHEVKHI